ncbi:hypothetical protein [Rhodanobacter sp. L36]|uniref:hypothetical protein n=1 Tax=Rhodanobacter sp. L36 TaxID=1747221 RepID=UPI00131D02FE|nr:hypothetical protein [Rhodanobacter sp. L36]
MAFTRNPNIDDSAVFNWLLLRNDSSVDRGSQYLHLGAVTSVNVQSSADRFQVSVVVQGETVIWGDGDDQDAATKEAMGLIERINSVHNPQAMAGLTPLS